MICAAEIPPDPGIDERVNVLATQVQYISLQEKMRSTTDWWSSWKSTLFPDENRRRIKKPRVLILSSGSVATVKIPQLVAELSAFAHVRVVCSTSALHFLERAEMYKPHAWQEFIACGGWRLVLTDNDEWRLWNKLGDPVLHIELRRWADLVVVAPASADLISKASCGISDNLVLCVLRAWDFKKPILLCPAMNTFMWNHPVTNTSLDVLRGWGYKVIDPISKTLACNDTGNGALADVTEIVTSIKHSLATSYPVADLRQAAQEPHNSLSASYPSSSLVVGALPANMEDDDDDTKVVNALRGCQQGIRDRRTRREVLTFSLWLVCLLSLCSLMDGDTRRQVVSAVQLAIDRFKVINNWNS